MEAKDSKIRIIFTSLSDVARQKQYEENFGSKLLGITNRNIKSLKDIFDAFQVISNSACMDSLTKRWEQIQASQVQAEYLKTPADYYRNGLTQIHKPVFCRPGTPISRLNMS